MNHTRATSQRYITERGVVWSIAADSSSACAKS